MLEANDIVRHMRSLMKRKVIAALVAAFAALQMMAGGDVESIPGWSSDFHASTNVAIQSHIPLVMIWGNRGCEHCQRLEADVQNAEFSKWRASSGYRYCFILGALGKDPEGAKGARTFAATAGGTHTSPRSYPLVCVYWKKPDGTVSARSFTTESAEKVRKAAEECFAGYEPFREPDGFSFVVSDTDYDRLEAEPGTPYVDVPLVRTINTGGIATNRLVAVWPDALVPPATNVVIWGDVETQRLVRVSLSRGDAAYPEGKALQLVLWDASGMAAVTGGIHFVSSQGSSVHNPKFVGESFGFGEWTMDYEAAKLKGGYVLANFSGGLWCPDCNGIDSTLFSDPRFTEWAVSNRVSLVLFDQGRSSTPATAAGNGTARLLTYAAGVCSFREGRPLASGASYLSRKAISLAAAAARIDMTTRFTQEWLPAESTAARLGNPTLLIVKDDKVAARVNLAVDGYVYDPVENILRLSEALKLADEVEEGTPEEAPPPVEIVNPYRGRKRQKQTIPLVAETGAGRMLAGELSVSITAKGKISAKYSGAGPKTYSFNGAWQGQDAASGLVSATLTKNGAVLELSLAVDGKLAAAVTVPGNAMYLKGQDSVEMHGEIGLPQKGVFEAYAGSYTVQMPASASDPEGLSMGGISVSLKMASASAIRDGKMTYEAILPDGSAVSGNAILDMRNEVLSDGTCVDCARCPIFIRSTRRVFGALLRIEPDGATTWDFPSRAEGLDVVQTADGTVAYCLMRGKVDMLTTHEAYGSWFASGSTPARLCSIFSLGDTLRASVTADGLAASERYGEIEGLPAATVRVSGKRFMVFSSSGALKMSSYAAKTGILKGKGSIRFDGRTLSGKFAGAVLPGWIDCQCVEGFVERPFAAGSFWFNDYVKRSGRWQQIVRSVPFEMAFDE